MTLKLGMQHRVLKYYQIPSNDFSETIVVYDLKLATDDRRGKKFPLTSNFVPLGLYAPAPGLYTCIK